MTPAIDDLSPMTDGIIPIGVAERKHRVQKAAGLMTEHGMDAVILEPGSGLYYFTGIQWKRTERVTAAILLAGGDLVYICPEFEEQRLRELITLGTDVHTWQEHESPYALIAGILKDASRVRRIGIEESIRFFLYDGLRREAPSIEFLSADPVTIACRAYKSPAEIALMQRATDITAEAFKICISLLREGMSQEEFAANSRAAHKALGVTGEISCQFGPGTAYPHGSKKHPYLTRGDVVLMDGSCTVDGYFSDISRTIVFGTPPTPRQREIWDLEKRAQAAAFAAARIGMTCGDVDAAARNVITAAGFGPGYKVPGLPHRTGHGIGLDIHEWHHIVPESRTPLMPGMCFSDEPMIAIYGEFGVRLEDCIYMAEDGPRFFSRPSPSIEQPFA